MQHKNPNYSILRNRTFQIAKIRKVQLLFLTFIAGPSEEDWVMMWVSGLLNSIASGFAELR